MPYEAVRRQQHPTRTNYWAAQNHPLSPNSTLHFSSLQVTCAGSTIASAFATAGASFLTPPFHFDSGAAFKSNSPNRMLHRFPCGVHYRWASSCLSLQRSRRTNLRSLRALDFLKFKIGLMPKMPERLWRGVRGFRFSTGPWLRLFPLRLLQALDLHNFLVVFSLWLCDRLLGQLHHEQDLE